MTTIKWMLENVNPTTTDLCRVHNLITPLMYMASDAK